MSVFSRIFNRRSKKVFTGLTITLFLVTLVLGCGGGGSSKSRPTVYKNPLGIAIGDPFVMKYKNNYYLYGTTDAGNGYKCWVSTDLVNWAYYGYAFHKKDQPDGLKFGMGSFWAPEVIPYKGKFYMVYTTAPDPSILGHSRLRLALAVSNSPTGPFINVKAPIFGNDDVQRDYLDGSIFIDEDGTPYLYYVVGKKSNVIDGKETSQIFVCQLSEDLTEVVGEHILVAQPEKPWEKKPSAGQYENEGPFVFKYEDTYYLTYSGNIYTTPDYSVGCATAPRPLGPWTKYDEPVLKKDLGIGVSGPGHNSFTISPDNSELFIVYHSHKEPGNPDAGRVLNIDRAYFENGVLKINGPTRSDQPMPSRNSKMPLDNIVLSNVKLK